MINKTLANDILNTAMLNGAKFVEIFVENNDKTTIGLINGKTETAISGIDFGVGIRIINDDKMLYSYTNSLDKDELINCAKNLAKAIKGEPNFKNVVFDPKNYYENSKHFCKISPKIISKMTIVDMLKSASQAAFNYNNLISQTNISYNHSIQDVCIINSDGLFATDKRVRTRAFISVVASNETEKQTGYFGPGALKGFEFYDNINLDELAKEASRVAVSMLNAKLCPSGKLPVVIDNGFGGVIFHEACGHGLEASAIAKDASVFCGKIGKKIASEKVTAIDDGTIKNSWGSINIDDEGTPAQKTILIENGVLKNYLTDKFNANKLGFKLTGSSRRESYKYIPVSRMTNTFIASGNDNKDDIIKNTEYGIYAKYMGGGSVNTASGEFNFSVNEAYIIKNGKITEPIRGATLIGKGECVLKNIDMVSDNLDLSEGMCGASSGSIPVTVGQPMIRVCEMTVGGRD